jgi:hypothetical protein
MEREKWRHHILAKSPGYFEMQEKSRNFLCSKKEAPANNFPVVM